MNIEKKTSFMNVKKTARPIQIGNPIFDELKKAAPFFMKMKKAATFFMNIKNYPIFHEYKKTTKQILKSEPPHISKREELRGRVDSRISLLGSGKYFHFPS